MKKVKVETIKLGTAFNLIQRDDAKLKLLIQTGQDTREIDISESEHQWILLNALFECIEDDASREHSLYMSDIERIKNGILGLE